MKKQNHDGTPQYPHIKKRYVDQMLEELQPWRNDPDITALPILSEVCIRTVRAYARRAAGLEPHLNELSHQEFWSAIAWRLNKDGFGFLASQAFGVAAYAANGEHPRHYIADVIKRARQHARNVANGRPWARNA